MSKSEVTGRQPSGYVEAEAHADVRARRGFVRRGQVARSDATRRRVVEAAMRLIVRKGYAELRVADVAREAEVSVGAQLHHFPSKDALVVAVIQHAFSQAANAGRRRAASHGAAAAREVLGDLIEDAKAFFFSEAFLVAINIVFSTQSSHVRDEVLEISRASRLPLEDAWRDAMVAAGISDDLSAELLTLTLCIIRGFTVRRLWDDKPDWQNRCLELWQDMVLLLLESRMGNPATGTVRARKGSAEA
jgi:AcrR family transcriptional regulator